MTEINETLPSTEKPKVFNNLRETSIEVEKVAILESGRAISLWGEEIPNEIESAKEPFEVSYEDLCNLVNQTIESWGEDNKSNLFDDQMVSLINAIITAKGGSPLVITMNPNELDHALTSKRKNFTTGQLEYGEAWTQQLQDSLDRLKRKEYPVRLRLDDEYLADLDESLVA